MGIKTGIEWTDATWNPLRGCSRVSEGCRNCYAEAVAYRFSGEGQAYAGLAVLRNGRGGWTGKVELVEKHLLDPLKWGAYSSAAGRGEGRWKTLRPKRIFVNSMSDLFHEAVPDEWVDRIFAVMALCPQHIFQVLTKRPERMRDYFQKISNRTMAIIDRMADVRYMGFEPDAVSLPLPNVWLGVSVENQAAADERIPLLSQTPAAVRFISAEPLLGPVDLTLDGLACWPCSACEDGSQVEYDTNANACGACDGTGKSNELALDWVICGGESGPGARPMHPDWARSLRDQCKGAGVPFFFKQWGEWLPLSDYEPFIHGMETMVHQHQFLWKAGTPNDVELPMSSYRVGKHAAGARLDGVEWKQFPKADG